MELHPDRRAAGTVTSRPVKRTCYFLAIPKGVVSWHMLMRDYPEVVDLARRAQQRLA